jgi:hypothetical protein
MPIHIARPVGAAVITINWLLDDFRSYRFGAREMGI